MLRRGFLLFVSLTILMPAFALAGEETSHSPSFAAARSAITAAETGEPAFWKKSALKVSLSAAAGGASSLAALTAAGALVYIHEGGTMASGAAPTVTRAFGIFPYKPFMIGFGIAAAIGIGASIYFAQGPLYRWSRDKFLKSRHNHGLNSRIMQEFSRAGRAPEPAGTPTPKN